MYIKFKGVSLLEILIVIGIFAIVSAGVTNLSIKTIEYQRDQQTLNYQTHIFNEMQDNIKEDIRSSFAVWVSTDENAPTAYQSYYVSQACAPASPNPNTQAARTGNTLNIIRELSYDPVAPQVTFDYVRYRFVNQGGLDYFIRMQSNPVTFGVEPSTLWPKDITAAIPLGSMPSLLGPVANLNMPDKAYNSLGQSNEEIAITGAFEAVYGPEFSPPLGSASPNCSFYINTVNLNGFNILARGYGNKYDTLFGKANFAAPSLTFQINSSIKFF